MRVVAAVGVTAVLTALPATTVQHASASSPLLTCSVGAHLDLTPGVGTQWVWDMAGSGDCVNGSSTYAAHVVASGTSDGLGLCDGGVVQNLALDVVLTLTSTLDGSVKTVSEKFSAPLTTFPIATPYLVTTGGGATTGAGNIDTHIFLHCPPGGTPSTFLVWEQIG